MQNRTIRTVPKVVLKCAFFAELELAYHLPFIILPATSIAPKATIAIMIVIQIGDKTQSHGQEITFVSFKMINSVTKTLTKPIHLLLFFLLSSILTGTSNSS